jgi:membrane-bound metal-dependent hydrolase YbcI (DUF457 family)
MTGTSHPGLHSPSSTTRALVLQDEASEGQVKVATHVVFAECCWFATSAVFDVQYGIPEVFAVAAVCVLLDADYPKSWLGHRLGGVSEDLHRLFGHRSFLHSSLVLLLITIVMGSPLWWSTGIPTSVTAVFVAYGSHLFADMMTVGGVRIFWPSRTIAVFPGRDEYRIVAGSGSEGAFLAVALVCGAPAPARSHRTTPQTMWLLSDAPQRCPQTPPEHGPGGVFYHFGAWLDPLHEAR